MMAEVRPNPPLSEPELHLLLSEMRDDRDRSRVREAAWISVVLHLVIIIALILSPRWMPQGDVVPLTSADILRDSERQLTYLDLPPDMQKAPRPSTDVISDKDRMAQTRTPRPDRETLKRLLDAHRAGAPGKPLPVAPPQQAQAAPQPASPAAGQPQQQPAQGEATRPRPEPANQLARLDPPLLPAGRGNNGFRTAPLSASSAIEQAARATANRRGVGGDFGLESTPDTSAQGDAEILSDTMGVDFGSYMSRVMQVVRQNWHVLIPEVARSPMRKQGRVTIEFAILKNGGIAGMRLIGPSGDVSLDRAAYGSITGSNPFQPLPAEFRGEYIHLRFRFHYNPDRDDLR